MEVRHPYRHNYAGYPLPEFVFHIGLSPTNQLHIQNDCHRRVKDIELMLENRPPRFDTLVTIFESDTVDSGNLYQLPNDRHNGESAESRGLYGGR